jgi:hypothetical protein
MEMEEAGLVLGRLDVPEPSVSTEGDQNTGKPFQQQ